MSFKSRYPTLIHVLATALVLTLPGLTILALFQTFQWSQKWQDQLPLVIELKKSYPIDSLNLLKNLLESKENTLLGNLEFYSKEEAFTTMKTDPTLSLNDTLLENPFRDLLILYTRDNNNMIENIEKLRKELIQFSIIDNIELGERIKSGLSRTLVKMIWVLGILTLFLGLIAIFIINFLVKINFERRLALINNIRLLGGSMKKSYESFYSHGLRLGLASSFLSVVFMGLGLLCLFILVPGFYELINLKNFIFVVVILAILGPTLHLIWLKKLIRDIFYKIND
ncbi:MAG: hypothetical protein IT267_03200 [Saprospiraceae bacterium]|nr:hypothetical protein [Saprospiraceae bacterium]